MKTGKSVMVAVFVEPYSEQRTNEKEKNIFALFLDIKAAFEKVDRVKLEKRLRKIGVSATY